MRAALSALFKYAIKEKRYIKVNPVALVPSRTENNKIVRYLSDAERDALLVECEASDWPLLYLLVVLGITTGGRKGELLSMRWEGVNWKERAYLLPTTKNGESRVLSLPQVAIKEMMRHRKKTGLIFASEAMPTKPMNFEKHWQKALEAAEIENFRFHDLRHTAASYLAMSGATLHEVGEVLGHKSLQTTKRYAHLSNDHKQKLTDRVMEEKFG